MMAKTNRSKLLLDIFIVAGISVALLVLFEAILRVILSEQRVKPEELVCRFNSDYLVSLRPNMNKTFVRNARDGGDIIYWQTNKESFRGPELRKNPKMRIMVYGDSNIQAIFSKNENTYVCKLEKYLNQKGLSDVETVNAGIIGSGPDQSLIRLTNESDIYKPQLVIFHIFADNDFGDIIRNRLFELDKRGNLRQTDHVRSANEFLQADRSEISSLFIVRAAHRLRRLLIVDKKVDHLNFLMSSTKREFLVYKNSMPREFSHFADHYDIDIALDPEQESAKTKINLMEAILKRANATAAEKGIRFMVVIQASGIDLNKSDSDLDYRYLRRFPKYKRSRLTDAAENTCRVNGIYFLNLFDLFVKSGPGELYFSADRDHWNDRGQDIAARETALYIMDRIVPGMR